MEYAIPNRWQYSVCMAVLDQFKGGESVNKGVSKGKTKKPCFSARLRVCVVPVAGLVLIACGLLILAAQAPLFLVTLATNTDRL